MEASPQRDATPKPAKRCDLVEAQRFHGSANADIAPTPTLPTPDHRQIRPDRVIG